MSDAADTWAQTLRSHTLKKAWNFVQGNELRAMMGPVDGLEPAVVEARAQKAALVWLKTRLQADLRVAHEFRDKTDLPWLDKLLTAARIQELAGVKIAKAGKSGGLRYDVTGLQASWYGRRLLESIGFGKRRSSMTKDEFATLVQACARIGLTLPETVSPTTTERFFSGEDI
jgi:hypothetical protein